MRDLVRVQRWALDCCDCFGRRVVHKQRKENKTRREGFHNYYPIIIQIHRIDEITNQYFLRIHNYSCVY